MKKYTCKKCGSEFDSISLLANHNRYKHNEKKMIKCDICGKELPTPNIKNHINSHYNEKSKINVRKEIIQINENETYICEYGCNRKANFILKNNKKCCCKHTSSCEFMRQQNSLKNKNKKTKRIYKKGMIPYNKGKKYDDLFGIERANEIKNKIREKNKNNPLTGKCKTEEINNIRKKKISDKLKERHANGFLPKAGRCKKIKYLTKKNEIITIDGFWELIVVLFFEIKNVCFNRNTIRYKYWHIEDRDSYYTPDFYVKDWQSFVEVKGYFDELSKEKYRQVKIETKLIQKQQILEIEKQTKLRVEKLKRKYENENTCLSLSVVEKDFLEQ